MFLLASSSVRSKQLLCFEHCQGQISEQKPATTIPPVKLLGMEVKPVTVAKDLGVIIDSSLSFNEHVTKTVSDCLHRLIRIDRIKHLLDRKTLLSLINTCFQ